MRYTVRLSHDADECHDASESETLLGSFDTEAEAFEFQRKCLVKLETAGLLDEVIPDCHPDLQTVWLDVLGDDWVLSDIELARGSSEPAIEHFYERCLSILT